MSSVSLQDLSPLSGSGPAWPGKNEASIVSATAVTPCPLAFSLPAHPLVQAALFLELVVESGPTVSNQDVWMEISLASGLAELADVRPGDLCGGGHNPCAPPSARGGGAGAVHDHGFR